MKIIYSKKKLKKLIHNEKDLGFVPTMGGIHIGHLSLIKKSLSQCNKTIVSIFVNKPQFNKNSDFKKYPKMINNDIKLLSKNKVDYLFLPTSKTIYPKGFNKNIKINSFSKKLCGKFRPGHFEAVIDVIERFVNLLEPKKIFLGEKDMQQLKLIEDFLKKKYKKIFVVGCKTVREKNGLAYSSRNLLLSMDEKKLASKIYRYLKIKKKKLLKNKISTKIVKKKILSFGIKKIDYISMIDINKIIKPHNKKKKYKIFIAYYLNQVRLIDNI